MLLSPGAIAGVRASISDFEKKVAGMRLQLDVLMARIEDQKEQLNKLEQAVVKK
jgi:hypothetical protein